MRFLPTLRRRLFPGRPRKWVRPWALSAPILVLVIALPLLRPLRYPVPQYRISDEEAARLATIQAIVEHVTIPAACAAGLVYRMGRLFDLRRPWRAALAAAAVLATGLISYATVLNPHVPAATL